jgi:hypothetical protein
MRLLLTCSFLFLLLLSCEQKVDNRAEEAFKKNSETVLKNLEGWQNENIDYSMYADDFIMWDTGFGAEKDSLTLEEMKEMDQMMWKMYDFKLLTSPPQMLPGVNSDTKLADGSVRHYSDWEITLPATDSTSARSGVIRLYESFDFNEEGKIIYQQVYGDFTGIMMHLHKTE